MQISFNTMINKFAISFVAVLSLVACSGDKEINAPAENKIIQPTVQVENTIDTTSVVPSTGDVYHSETFETTGQKGWGYRIMLNGELYINQPHIPAVQGNRGFSNPIFAKKTADYAISKIEQGFIPPTLSIEELDSLGVLN